MNQTVTVFTLPVRGKSPANVTRVMCDWHLFRKQEAIESVTGQTSNPCSYCGEPGEPDWQEYLKLNQPWIDNLLGGWHIYIAGPMSGLPDNNRSAFYLAEFAIRRQGAFAYNPARLDQSLSYDILMRESAKMLLDCHRSVFLRGWPLSKGARCEHVLAKRINHTIHYEIPHYFTAGLPHLTSDAVLQIADYRMDLNGELVR